MRLTILGGTPRHDRTSLCLTCRHATVIEGSALRDRIVECSQLSSRNARITFPVAFCNRYADRRQPSLRDMEEIAWVLRTDPKKNTIGFVHARYLSLRDRYVLDDDDRPF